MPKFESRPAGSYGFKEIVYEKQDWVATITLDRPHNYNAYSTEALVELASAFQDAAFDDSVGVVVYTGAGTRAFCTGGDVKEYEVEYTQRPRDYWKYMQLFRAYIESIVGCGKPVVARLNGMAVGGGNESQMACDLAVMAEHAWIGQVGTRVGSVAAGGATQWLPIMVGDRRAREMLLFNGQIPARQCLDWGLVNRVVPSVTKDGEFIEGASPEQIAQGPQGAGRVRHLAGASGRGRGRVDHEAAAAVPRVRPVHEAAGELLEGAGVAPDHRSRRATGWRSTTPAWSRGRGCGRSWRSGRRGTWPCGSGPPRAARASSSGARPPWSCGDCGAQGIPASFAFCGVCGTPLSGNGTAAGRPTAEETAPSERPAGSG
jgi:enoyl-CoA hydratase/carnithine racemase